MKYLFVDNFRGFTRTVVPIRDVNFFVGENSTGKTSILALIKLLDSPEFWFDQKFNTDEIRFGTYNDIVSVGASDRSYFRIGLVEVGSQTGKKIEDSKIIQAFLFTFTEEEGIPILTHYTAFVEEKQIHVVLGARTLKYKDVGQSEKSGDIGSIKNMLMSWADTHQVVGKGYKIVKIPEWARSYHRTEAIAVINSILKDILRGRSQKRDRYPFRIRRPFDNDVVMLAPIRTRPQRTYDTYSLEFSSEGEHTPYLIKKFLTRRTSEQRKQADSFLQFINKFGRDSGLFKTITVKDYDKRTTTSPFELDIILEDQALSMDNVGYGVSQALPLIVEIFIRERGTWFAIQQPEIHLHPRAQAALGHIMFELALAENKKFIIETHSDFTIDGFRLNYRGKKSLSKPDSQIIFFERKQRENISYEIRILDDGEISDSQPRAYREFFLKEQKRLLGL